MKPYPGKKWRMKVLICFPTQKRESIEIVDDDDGDELSNTLLLLCKLRARFVYENHDVWAAEPVADPIAKTITYICEAFPR